MTGETPVPPQRAFPRPLTGGGYEARSFTVAVFRRMDGVDFSMLQDNHSLTVAARRTRSRFIGTLFSVCLVGCATARAGAQDGPAPTAGAERDPSTVATLRFRIEDTDSGKPIPGRLTFRGADGGDKAELFPNDMADPEHLAVRHNVVYTITGEGVITVPPGRYIVYASRGIEWSIDSTGEDEREFTAGSTVDWTAHLTHEVDTSGWIGGDFHLHTLTHSGHGDANMNERIISIVGEGVEFAVATDHNHHTDYHPTMEHVGASDLLTSVTGNEVSTSVGHFNAFPLDPHDEPVNHRLTDANALFKLIREQSNEFGIVPIVQLNHPRWNGIDYFAQTGLDPVTGTSELKAFSHDFDSLEVMNGNEGRGMFEADVDGIETGANIHAVLQDWYNLLNRGYRCTAVGNSDSHTVHYDMAGYPRNFVMYSGDDTKPGMIEPALVAQGVRAHQVTASTGPFLQYTVNGYAPGTDITAGRDGIIDVDIDVQAASWIPCDRIRVIVNGDEATRLTIDDTPAPGGKRSVQRFDSTIRLSLEHDAWLAVIADSVTKSLDPIVGPQGRPVYPMAVANPTWIDVEGDGAWTSPWDRAVARVANADTLAEVMPANRADAIMTILAAAQARSPFASDVIRAGLRADDYRVRLAAVRAAETVGDASLLADLITLWDRREELSAYTNVALVRALHACEAADAFGQRLTHWMLSDAGLAAVQRYQPEVASMMPGNPARDWMVLGYFANPVSTTIQTSDYGPEGEYARWQAGQDLNPDEPYVNKINKPIEWKPLRADGAGGYLNLQQIEPNRAMYERSIAYARAWVRSPRALSVPIAFGTDDGSQVYVNGEKIHEDTTQHGASPLAFIKSVSLKAGWNHVLFKVENGGGRFGMYFRVLSNDIEYSAVGPM